MTSFIAKLKMTLQKPYFWALFFVALLPLLPDYIAFVSVIVATIFAYKTVKLEQRTWRIGTVGKLLLLFSAYQTLTCFISTHPIHSLFIALMWWFFFAAYLVVVNVVINKHRLKNLLFLMTIVAGAVGLIAFIQYQINVATGSNTYRLWLWLDNIIYPLIKFGIVDPGDYVSRAYSTFSNPNIMAKYLVMVAPFIAAYNFIEKRKPYKIICRICLVFTYAGVIYSFSRGGYLAMILLGVALVVIHLRKKILSILIYAATTLLLLPTAVVERLGAMNKIGERELIWQNAIEWIKDSPIYGYGAGTQPSFALLETLNLKSPAAHAHNVVLQLLLEGGIIALILMGAIGFKVIKDGVVLMLRKHEQTFWVGFALCGFAVMFLTHGMVDNPFSTPRLVANFITILGIVEQGYHLHMPKTTKKRLG